jgi:hypothetical protein
VNETPALEKLPGEWARRDYPVLREVTRLIDGGASSAEDWQVAESIDMPIETVRLAAGALARRGYVRLDHYDESTTFRDIASAAYLITGLHPDTDDALSGLVELLRQAADASGDEEERSRLRRAADGLLGVSRDVMVGVLTAYATKFGMP